jgi:hypothetical protein
MRWIRAMAAVFCAGLLACGGGGGGEAEPSGSPGEDAGAVPADVAEGGVLPGYEQGNCPAGDGIESATGETILVADTTADDPTFSLFCTYQNGEGLRFFIYCEEHATLDEAQAAVARVRDDPGARPYDVGEEAVIVNLDSLEEDAPVRLLAQVATVRSGLQTCEVQYQVMEPDSDQPPEGVDEALRYLATATTSAA